MPSGALAEYACVDEASDHVWSRQPCLDVEERTSPRFAVEQRHYSEKVVPWGTELKNWHKYEVHIKTGQTGKLDILKFHGSQLRTLGVGTDGYLATRQRSGEAKIAGALIGGDQFQTPMLVVAGTLTVQGGSLRNSSLDVGFVQESALDCVGVGMVWITKGDTDGEGTAYDVYGWDE